MKTIQTARCFLPRHLHLRLSQAAHVVGLLVVMQLGAFAQSEPNSELLSLNTNLTPNLAFEPLYGQAVAVGSNVLAVGSDTNVYLYRREETQWTWTTNLAFTSKCEDLAISGNRLVVGLPWDAGYKGRVDVFTNSLSGTEWSVERQLTASDGKPEDFFGRSVDVEGNTIVVGSYLADAGGSQKGQVYVYEYNTVSKNWDETKLGGFVAGEVQNGDEFGWDVSIGGDVIGVCVYQIKPGYIFSRSNNTWKFDGRTPVNASQMELDGDRVVVASNGELRFYTYVGSALDPTFSVSLGGRFFGETYGRNLAIHGNVVAASGFSDGYPGTVHVFETDGETWQEQITLQPLIATNGNNFGKALAISGDTVVVGAPVDYSDSGAAHVYSPSYGNPESVASYVRKHLYLPDAGASILFENDSTAFRYKDLIYDSSEGDLRLDLDKLATLFGGDEISRSEAAEAELVRGLQLNPDSVLLQDLLLDIYYDRSLPKNVLAADELSDAERIRFSPPSIPGGLVLDDEVALFEQSLADYQSAMVDYFKLFDSSLGMTNLPPMGYQIFEERVPRRGLGPSFYYEGQELVPVNGSTNLLFDGYKDFVYLYSTLRDYGRSAVTFARFLSQTDPWQAESAITEAQQFLFLHASILEGVFPDLDLNSPALTDSGLGDLMAAVGASLDNLETLKQALRGGSNLLGFEDNFLMLVQKFSGQSEELFDSFDAFEMRLNPSDLSSPLRYALELQSAARDSYSDYHGFQDQLETQLGYIAGSTEDRLFQIVGGYPGTPEYEKPENNEGSEIWLQLTSIEVAQLQIRRNKTEISNLEEEVRIEVERSQSVQDTKISYGNKQASLTEWIGHINAAQAYADKMADAFSATSIRGALTSGANAVAQAAGEEAKGQLNAEKERLAAEESAKIEGIESAAKVETLMLGMKTLAIDSQEAAITLKQELGRLTALLREKEDLERTLAESETSLAGRYFADPTHHLRYQHQTLLANLSFEEAQKWLYFMARALEYKWNTPFMNYFYLGRKWSTDTLFKLRNAAELQEFYNAMVSFNSLVQLPQDDYFDWFSVREDFLGYKELDDYGSPLYYPDPANLDAPATLRAREAFRSYLRTRMDAIGNIRLEFSTRREIPGGTFYRGPRYDENRNVISAGLFLDKIKWLQINLPGSHSLGRSQLAGELSYGGTGFVRNFDVGTFHPDRPDRLQDEETAYSTRYWFFHAPSASWRFSESLKSPVTMQLSGDPRIPPSVQEIDVFKERSVATTGWKLTIPTEDLGVPVLNVAELDDIELYFYHYAVSRQLPEGNAAVQGEDADNVTVREIPFPYSLRRDIVDR